MQRTLRQEAPETPVQPRPSIPPKTEDTTTTTRNYKGASSPHQTRNNITLLHFAGTSSSVEESHSRGKEIWAHMDQPKIIFYCRFQVVDGSASLAHAHGSNALFPFKPKPEKKKPLSIKKIQGKISPSSVKRSHRLRSK